MLQMYRPASHAPQARGQRLRQPQVKEERKDPQPETTIKMLNGIAVMPSTFQDLRSNSHKEFGSDFGGISEKIRSSIPSTEWKTILAWINLHRPKYGRAQRQNDLLVAVAIDFEAQRRRRSVTDIVAEIQRDETARILFSR